MRAHIASFIALSFLCVSGAAAGGCAKASGSITGGDALFDASAPPAAPIDAGPLGQGHTFDELYADYFGNPARASCAGNGSCHGADNQRGSQDSSFVCPAGDKNACYTSLVSAAADLVNPGDAKTSILLTKVLRRADGTGGNMPQSPGYAFSDTDLQRISDWIDAGAKNDVAIEDGGRDDAADEGGVTDAGGD